jgi:K+-sensing histidine kinase KdpD
MIYLLAVVIVAVIGGVVAARLAAVLTYLLFNWFLTPPTTRWPWRTTMPPSTCSCSSGPRSWSASLSS